MRLGDGLATCLENLHFLVRCFRYRFRTERLQLRTLMRLDLTGATVIDIGANKGIYCFWMARAVGALGRVLAFEPQPEMRAYIERRKAWFGWQNLVVFGSGLSNRDSVAQLCRARIGDGSASLQPERRRGGDETISVALTTLDAIHNLSGLKFIKCDVEGHELAVFQGAEQTIRRFRPVIQFEGLATETSHLFLLFRRIGYSGVMLLGNEYLHYTNPDGVPHYKFGRTGHRDFLFFPPEAIGTTIPRSISRLFPVACLDFPTAEANASAPPDTTLDDLVDIRT